MTPLDVRNRGVMDMYVALHFKTHPCLCFVFFYVLITLVSVFFLLDVFSFFQALINLKKNVVRKMFCVCVVETKGKIKNI